MLLGAIALGIFIPITMAEKRSAIKEAGSFLGLLGAGKIPEAYEATTLGFRADMDEKAFAALIEELGLDDYASWSSDNASNWGSEYGWTLQGFVKTKSGRVVRLKIKLVREEGAWKVRSLERPQKPPEKSVGPSS